MSFLIFHNSQCSTSSFKCAEMLQSKSAKVKEKPQIQKREETSESVQEAKAQIAKFSSLRKLLELKKEMLSIFFQTFEKRNKCFQFFSKTFEKSKKCFQTVWYQFFETNADSSSWSNCKESPQKNLFGVKSVLVILQT